MRFALLFFVFALSACGETKAVSGNEVVETTADGEGGDTSGSGDTIDVDEDTGGVGDDVQFDLVFAIDAESTIAGEAVGFSINWAGDDDSTTEVTDYSITSDAEDPLTVADSTLTATRAATHTLTVTATKPDGESASATATLNVDAGAATVLSVSLSPTEVTAGESVTATISAVDAYGNEATSEGAVLTASDGVTIDGSTLLNTTAGTHTATATLGELTSDASWSVVAGEAISIDLVLEDAFIELGDDTDYEAFAIDAYGNPIGGGDIRVWADEGVTIDADRGEFTFDEEGVFNCYAEIIGTEIIDTETITIDATGPSLTVNNPERGDWTTESSAKLSGEAIDVLSGPASIITNDTPIALEDDGSFETTMALSFGVNTFETVATDTHLDEDGVGNQSKDIRSMLQANAFLDPDADIEDGLLVRMWEGEGGLGQLESMVDGLTESFDLDSLVEGELFSESGFGYSVSIEGESIDYEDITMSIDATATGTLDARVTIANIEMKFGIGGWVVLPLFPLSEDGLVNIDAIYIDISLTPAIEDGTLTFNDITYSVPPPEGVRVTVSDTIGGLIETAGYDMEALIEEQIVDGINAAMDGAMDGLFDDLLGSLDIAQEFDVEGMTYTLYASAQDVVVDDNGMTVSMSTRVTPEEVLSAGAVDSVPGIPYYGFTAPSFSAGGSGTQMGLSTDVLNQMMFAFWQGGMLDQSLSADALGIDVSFISLLLPGLESMDILTTPLLPPVVVPVPETETGNQFELQIGSMLTSIYDGEFTAEALALDLYVSATRPLTLSMDDAGEIAMTLGDASVGVDLVYMRPDLSVSKTALEDLLGSVLAGYLPEIAGDLASIPTPETDAFAIAFTSSSMAGADVPPGYWLLTGSLE